MSRLSDSPESKVKPWVDAYLGLGVCRQIYYSKTHKTVELEDEI